MNQNYILRLDIPVQNFVPMHKLQSVEQITNDKGSSFLRKSGSVGDDIEELAVTTKLQDNINVIFVVEVS
jgi:hypothetical protein